MSKRERVLDTVLVIGLLALCLFGCAIDMAQPSLPPSISASDRG